MDFPLDSFPPVIREAAEALTQSSNAPPELTVPMMLAIAAIPAQAVWNAKADWGEVPCSLNVAVLMESGGLKSSTFSPLNRGYENYCETAQPIFEQKMAQYRADLTNWEIEMREAKQEKDSTLRMAAIMHLEQNHPVRPPEPQHQIENPSVVGLTRAFESKGKTLGLVSTDAGAFLSGHAMSDRATSQQLTAILAKVWSGESYDRLTGEEQQRIEGVRISALWLVQAEMAAAFVNNPMFASQGILGRFMIVQAPSFQKPPASFASDPDRAKRLKAERDDACRAFCRKVAKLYARANLASGELDPVGMEWDASALLLGEQWINDFARRWSAKGSDEDGHHKSFFQRLEEHALRVATVLSALEGESVVTKSNLACAHAFVEYLAHSRRAIEAEEPAQIGDEHRATKALEGWLATKVGGETSLRDIKRNCGRAAFAKAPKRIQDAAIKQLIETGTLEEVEVTKGNGQSYEAFMVRN